MSFYYVLIEHSFPFTKISLSAQY